MNRTSRAARPPGCLAPARHDTRAIPVLLLGLFLLSATLAHAATLTPLASRDKKVVKRWSLPGTPRGLALASSGVLYVGLAEPQSVVAIEPSTGSVLSETVLDSADIASTKELTTLRLTSDQSRLVVANGSDESVTILALPEMKIVREIGLEGELIRDAVPDPAGRSLYVLGRTVHVYDADGERELKSISDVDPMAIAVNGGGTMLAVVGSEQFGKTRATSVVLYDAATLKEVDRQPLQTDREIVAAVFAADDRALVVFARDWVAEKPLAKASERKMQSAEGAPLKITIEFGDLMNSVRICLPAKVGPQLAAAVAGAARVYFPETHCSSGETFTASKPLVEMVAIYPVSSYALAYDGASSTIFATDPAGFLTQYRIAK